MQQDYEKLGVFYLGREYDLGERKLKSGLILYDSKDLVTHGVCVGMTGSGKTGLCLSLLEEAAIDGIPALLIDPKGDLANLLMQFPNLKGEEFEPWVNTDDARKKGLPVKEFAAQEAEKWKKGLADWDQDGARIQRLKDSADFVIYTPGSNAGIPVSILQSFNAPTEEVLGDSELLRERINTTATSLLSLLDIEADPVQSREHILLSTIFNSTWKAGKDLDLASLIQQIQTPPINRVGVLELETFYPAKDRFALAMLFNNLLASPSFESWMEGVPLDVQSMLYTKEGKPRFAILSIAHLNDTERMFFVSLMLNQVIAWMRHQPGTTSLRALVYMDEIFGYFPPVKNPPSKMPLLTLLKQARAFGVGVMLATQNPVDLDYKGLANCGTWLIGRLQTERDKMRVLDGLEGAATNNGAKFDRSEMEQILAGLGSRVFLLHNVHEDHPVVFQSRWALSYLRGPMTRTHIKALMDPRRSEFQANASVQAKPKAVAATEGQESHGQRAILPPEVPQFFLPTRSAKPEGAVLLYRPALFGAGQIYFSDTKVGVELTRNICLEAEITEDAVSVEWPEAAEVDWSDDELEKEPSEPECVYAVLAPAAAKVKNYDSWRKAFADHLYRNVKLDVFKSPSLGEVSKPEEKERDFRIRLQQVAREQRDQAAEQLRQRFAPKIAAFDEKIRKAIQAVEKKKSSVWSGRLMAMLSMAGTVFGAFLSRKVISVTNLGKATTSVRSATKTIQDSQSVAQAKENVEALEQQKAELEEQFKTELESIDVKIDPLTEELDSITIKPKKTNITVRLLALVWIPYWKAKDGKVTSAVQ